MSDTTTHEESASHIAYDELIVEVPLDAIETLPINPRLAEAENQEELQALAHDMMMSGLLQPVGVKEVHGKGMYQLVFGSRRVAAACLLGWATIPAVLLADDADAERLAAAENLHRRPMNPLEEAMAVEFNMRRYAHLPATEAQSLTAEDLGRSPQWVRDRLFLSRLCGYARAKVMDGTMTLAIARELAKVVDPRTQEELINRWYGQHADPIRLEWARQDVNARALSLHQVPWLLDSQTVAKGCPACTGCPENTANARQSGLFEHDHQADIDALGDDDGLPHAAPRGPFCLNRACFERKSKAVEEAARKAAKKVAKSPSPETAIEETRPEWADPEAFAKQVQANAKAPAQESPKQKPISAAESKRRWQEEDKKRQQRERAERARLKAVATAASAIPGCRALVFLLAELPGLSIFGRAGDHRAKVRDKAEVPKALRDLVAELKGGSLTLADLDKLAEPAWDMRGRSPWQRLLARVGKPTKAFLTSALLGEASGDEGERPSVPAGTARKGARGRKDAAIVPRRAKKPARK